MLVVNHQDLEAHQLGRMHHREYAPRRPRMLARVVRCAVMHDRQWQSDRDRGAQPFAGAAALHQQQTHAGSRHHDAHDFVQILKGRPIREYSCESSGRVASVR
jgi:hypothetical protein